MNNRGATLLELMTAMVVSAIVISLAFFIYSRTVKNSAIIFDRSSAVARAITIKYQIDGSLREGRKMTESNMSSLRFIDLKGDERKIECLNDELNIDGTGTGLKLRKLQFEMVEGNGRLGVVWDAINEDSVWCGGGKVW